MVAYSRRPQSGHITCYFNRTFDVLPRVEIHGCRSIRWLIDCRALRRSPTGAPEEENACSRVRALFDRLYDHLIMPRTDAIRSYLAETREQVAHMHQTLDRMEANSEEYHRLRRGLFSCPWIP